MNDLRDYVAQYLKNHQYANMATIHATDPMQPHVSTVAYVNDGLNLYFATSSKTHKVVNIEKNSKVALTIDEDEPDWMKITGLQIEGKASQLKEEDIGPIFEIYAEKFPVAKSFPVSPDDRFVKITPVKIWILDYRKGFAHRDYLEL